MSNVRARMYVSQVARNAGDTATVTLQAVSRGKENGEWSKYTPSANFTMTLTREASGAFTFFNDRVGKEVFVDISDAQDPICTQCGETVDRSEGTEIRGTDGYIAGEYVHTHCHEAAKERLGIA